MIQEAVLAALLSLPTYKEDIHDAKAKHGQMLNLSDGIALASASDDWPLSEASLAATLIVIGWHESGFSIRVQRGECKPYECDAHRVDGQLTFRAAGPWQTHRNKLTEPYWHELLGSDDVNAENQALAASRMVIACYWRCARGRRTDWLAATLNGYAGRRCDSTTWYSDLGIDKRKGLAARLSTYDRIRKHLAA